MDFNERMTKINANYKNKWENATTPIARKIRNFLIIKCVLSVSIDKIWDGEKGNVRKRIIAVFSGGKFNNI